MALEHFGDAFNLVTGIYEPDGGEILFDGRNIIGLEPHRIAHGPQRLRRVAQQRVPLAQPLDHRPCGLRRRLVGEDIEMRTELAIGETVSELTRNLSTGTAQLLVLEALLAVGVVVLYGTDLSDLAMIVPSAVLATVGLSAAATIYGVLAAGLRMGETVLPVLILPVVAPVLPRCVLIFAVTVEPCAP